MSINHFSSELPDTIWWTQQHHQSSLMEQIPQNTLFHHHLNTGQNTPFSFNLNEQEEEKDEEMKLQSEEAVFIAKEAMFEKPLTPSDVGKLNRLVIPKQHAEKYFPLGGINDSVEKGLLLSFEDESGKTWRFRYSYWNSSQSYVLTKGWSRFVKEKRLEAGDVVVFDRFRTQGDRFFIGWRRRNAPPPENMPAAGWNRLYYSGYPYPTHPTSLPYQTHCPHAVVGGGSAGGTQNQTTPGGNSKTVLRLFGVNLECQSDEPIAADGSSQSQREAQGQQHQPHYYSNFSNHHTHMQDTNFSRTR